MKAFISGIQQVGVGVKNVEEAWAWYRKAFGMDIPIFQDSAEATIMAPYTGGSPHSRTAVLAVNLGGGGGFEIWQFTSRTPSEAGFDVSPGDLGITSVTMKSSKIEELHAHHRSMGAAVGELIGKDPSGRRTYFVRDPYGNSFQIVESDEVFARTSHPCGGVCGVTIGVTDIDAARPLYARLLGYSMKRHDVEGVFDEYRGLPSGEERYRRMLLSHEAPGLGSFGRMFGSTSIELVQALEQNGRKIFENRYWGDCGFIHVCFDVHHTDELKATSERLGFPFTVDSGSAFDMGEAAGRFSYTEDPDGTLIEMVETFSMPILKKPKIALDLTKRDPERTLPDWMLKSLKFSRVR